MKTRATVKPVAVATTFVLTGTSSAAFIGMSFSILDLGAPGGTTYRIYTLFDDPADQLLAVSGNEDVAGFQFWTNTVLMNDGGALSGLKPEDFPGIGAPWDSWITIGAATVAASDTDYSPGFAGSDGVSAVIRGSTLSQPDNGGWFDSNPLTPEDGGSVLIAQLTVADKPDGSRAQISMTGTIDYNPAGEPPAASEFFAIVSPSPPACGLIALAGLFFGRRRRA